MPRRSKIARLPKPERDSIEEFLDRHGFSDYRQLQAELGERGIEISRASLQRYGREMIDSRELLENRLQAIRLATAQAREVVAEIDTDKERDISRALASIVQSRLFDALIKLQDGDDLSLPQIARMAGELEKISLARDRYVMGLEAQIKNARRAIETELDRAGSDRLENRGLSLETEARIRHALLDLGPSPAASVAEHG